MTAPIAVFVDHVAELSGAERSLLEIVTHLDGRCPVVILGSEGPLADELREAGIRVDIVPIHPAAADARRAAGLGAVVQAGRFIEWGAAVRRRVVALGASVVVANSLKSGVALTARRPPVRFVWAVRDRIDRDYLGRPALTMARLALATGPDVVVANSTTTAATCPRRRRPIVIPPSVTPPDVSRGGSNEPLTVAVVGRLSPWKGQLHALDAFYGVFADGEERLRFVGGPLFGEDDYEAELRSRSTVLGKRVSFTGHVKDVGAALEGVHVLVHSSLLAEPFGRSVVEGMGAGLAVVAMNAGGPSEIVTNGVDGLLVPPGDGPALGAALVRLRSDRALRERLGRAGIATAAAYRPERLAERWAAVLDGTTEQRR
jgi:glycosyltransferase involved in cell wall biosynthesis